MLTLELLGIWMWLSLLSGDPSLELDLAISDFLSLSVYLSIILDVSDGRPLMAELLGEGGFKCAVGAVSMAFE